MGISKSEQQSDRRHAKKYFGKARMTRLIVGTMDTDRVASSSVSTNERHKVTLKVTVPEDIIPASKVLAGIVTYNAEVNCISLRSINNFERGSEGSPVTPRVS